MLKIYAAIIPAFGALAITACQPEPTPEQKAAAAFQQMAQQMGAALGGVDANGNPQLSAEALGQAMAMAGAMNPEMSAEDRAKLNAISGAIASGQVHPAAASYVAGLDKVYTILATIKDDEREVAFGSAYPQLMGFGLKLTGVMMPLMSNPALGEKVSDLLEDMPDPG